MKDSTNAENTLVTRHFNQANRSRTVGVFLLIATTGFTSSSNALSGCPNADVSDEINLENYTLISVSALPDNRLEVELQADVSNMQAGSFSSINIVPKFHKLNAMNAEVVQPMLFPPLSPFSSVMGTSVSQNMIIQLDAGKLNDLMLRLSTGNILSEVSGDENVVLEPGVIVQRWESWMDAYALLPGGMEPDYSPGASVSLTMINPSVTPVTLPDGFASAANSTCSISPSASEQWILRDDNNFDWENIPFAWRNLKINSIVRIPLVEGSDDCSSYIGAIIDAEIPDIPLTDLVESGSFCSGEEHYIDPPVSTTRSPSFEGDDIPDEESASNAHPIHFNELLIDNLKISGQLQGYILKPKIELRIRPIPASDESRVKIRTSIDNNVNMAVTLTAEEQVSIPTTEIEVGLLCFPLPPLNFGPLEIPWTLRLAHKVGVSAELSAGVTTGIEKQFSAGYALEWDDGAFDFESWGDSPPVQFTPPRLPSVTANATAWSRFTTGIELGSIYPDCETGAGPYLDMKLALGLAMDSADTPAWRLVHEGEIVAGLEFSIMGIDIGPTIDAPIVTLAGSEELVPEEVNPPEDNSATADKKLIQSSRLAALPAETIEYGEDQRWLMAVENLNADYSGGGFGPTDVSATDDGGAAVVSHADITGYNPLMRFDAVGRLMWQQEYRIGRQPVAVTVLEDDSLTVVGKPSWLAHHAADGQLSWSQDYRFGDASGGASLCSIEDMVRFDNQSMGSGYLLAGIMQFGPNLPCAIRVDDTGSPIWAKVYQRQIAPGSTDVYLSGKWSAVIATEVGFVLAGHEALLTPAAISRPLVVEIDDQGEPLWSSSIDLPNVYRSGKFQDLSEADDGSLYLTGYSGAVVTQDGAMLVSHLDADGQNGESALFFPGSVETENYLTRVEGYSPLDKGLAIASVTGGAVLSGVLDAHEYGIGEEAWILRINDRLGVEWLFSIDGPGDESIDAISPTDDGLFVSGTTKSLIPIETGSDNKNSLLLAKLPFEGRPGGIRSDTSLLVQYREPSIVSGIPGADYGLNTGIVYTTEDLAIDELGEIVDLLDVVDDLCVTRLTPHSGRDTEDSAVCTVPIPEQDLIPGPDETDNNTDPFPDPASENGGGGASLVLVMWLILLLFLKRYSRTSIFCVR